MMYYILYKKTKGNIFMSISSSTAPSYVKTTGRSYTAQSDAAAKLMCEPLFFHAVAAEPHRFLGVAHSFAQGSITHTSEESVSDYDPCTLIYISYNVRRTTDAYYGLMDDFLAQTASFEVLNASTEAVSKRAYCYYSDTSLLSEDVKQAVEKIKGVSVTINFHEDVSLEYARTSIVSAAIGAQIRKIFPNIRLINSSLILQVPLSVPRPGFSRAAEHATYLLKEKVPPHSKHPLSVKENSKPQENLSVAEPVNPHLPPKDPVDPEAIGKNKRKADSDNCQQNPQRPRTRSGVVYG